MLAGCVGIVPHRHRHLVARRAAVAAGRGHRAGPRVGRGRGRLLHPARGGLSARRPVGRLPARARDRAAAGGRSSASGCSASGWASPDRSGSSRCWPGSCGCSGRGAPSPWPRSGRRGRAEGRRRQRDPVRPRDRRDDRDLHRDRSARDAPDRRRSPYAAILWADLLGRAGRLGRRSWPAATCSATGPRRPAGPPSVAG